MSIPTREERVPLGGVEALVRVVRSLRQKDTERRLRDGLGDPTMGEAQRGIARSGGQVVPRDPFLPCEPALYVADVNDTHVAVLNKFSVVDEHLLIVTREFEHQDRLLGLRDFEALFRCLAEYPALGFYNGGALAGASQPHKHLQVVPLPLGKGGPAIPIEPLLAAAVTMHRPGVVDALPFRHAFVRWADDLGDAPWERLASEAMANYPDLLRAVDRLPREGPHGETCDPYNLLCTREWMLAIPRVEECFEGISLNSLAFAGAFLVRDQAQADRLREVGPWLALARASGAFPKGHE